MIEPTVLTRVDGRVGRLTLARPARLNALNEQMIAEITAAAEGFDALPEVRVVLITAQGRAFSAGADLDEYRERAAAPGATDHDAVVEQARRGTALTDAIAGMRAVTVAAVRGPAVGGAVALLAACRLRVVADGVAIRIPELAMGIPLAWGAIPRLVRQLGAGVTSDLLLTGRAMDAAEAVARGWACARHPAEWLDDAAEQLAESIAQLPPRAVDTALKRIDAAENGLPTDDDAVALAVAIQDPEAVRATLDYLRRVGKPPRPDTAAT